MTDNVENIAKLDKLKSLELFHKIPIECDMGWFEILYDFGQKITSFCRHNNIPMPRVAQVKEKFGSIRLYLRYDNEYDESHNKVMRQWVKNIEAESLKICELCGEDGVLVVTGGRWHVSCENHLKQNSISAEDFMQRQKEMRKDIS